MQIEMTQEELDELLEAAYQVWCVEPGNFYRHSLYDRLSEQAPAVCGESALYGVHSWATYHGED